VNGSDPRGLCVLDNQYNYWDTAPPDGGWILQDYGSGNCDQNQIFLSQVAGGGSVTLNGYQYQPGDGNSGGFYVDDGSLVNGTSVSVTSSDSAFSLDALWAAFMQYLQESPVTGSITIPIPETFGILGVQLSGAYLPQSGLVCGQLSLAAGLPGTVGGFSIGTLLSTDPGSVISSFSGWGGSLSLTPPVIGLGANGLGVQYGTNGVWGPTLTSKGSSISGGYGACWQTGSWNLVTSPADLVPPVVKSGASGTTPPLLPRLQ
jgi:hypothetical protein